MTEIQSAAAGAAGSSAGALLRAARERQGLHIAALAAAIKIPQRKLEALEADRFDELPDATFTRALAHHACVELLKIDAAPVLAQLPPLPQAGRRGLAAAAGGLNAPFRDRPGRADPAEVSPCGAIRCSGPRWRCWWRPQPSSCCRPAGGRTAGPAVPARSRAGGAGLGRSVGCRGRLDGGRIGRQLWPPVGCWQLQARPSAAVVEVVHSVPAADVGRQRRGRQPPAAWLCCAPPMLPGSR